MKRLFRLLVIENKRAWKIFPKMLLQAVVLTLVVGTIAFCASELLYQDGGVEVRVAVVMEEENQLTRFALDYVKQAEEEITFVITDSEEALAGVEQGDYAAAIILAPRLIEGILNGENPPVLVVYNESFSLAGGLLKELTQAGAKMLSVAQAEIYAMYEMAAEYGKENQLADFQNVINNDNLGVAMNRSTFFDYEEVTATGSFSVKTYYVSAAIVAVLLFFGIPLGMFLQQEKINIGLQLKRAGIGGIGQQLVRMVILLGLYGVLSFLATIVGVWVNDTVFHVGGFVLIWMVAGSMATFLLFVYEITEKKSSAIFLLAFLTLLLLFFGGGIIPQTFFPAGLKAFAVWLPSGYWISAVGAGLEGEMWGKALGVSVGYGCLFLGAAVLLRCRRLEKNG